MKCYEITFILLFWPIDQELKILSKRNFPTESHLNGFGLTYVEFTKSGRIQRGFIPSLHMPCKFLTKFYLTSTTLINLLSQFAL